MKEIVFGKPFKTAFRKRIKSNPHLEARFWQKLEIQETPNSIILIDSGTHQDVYA